MTELALFGGTPVRQQPLPPWPVFEQDEIDAVTAVLRSGKVNYWTGEQGREFEKEFAHSCGVRHAIAVTNGTVALELALYALEIVSGAEVIVTPRSFVASASCAVMRGARPVFVDVDRNSQNIDPNAITNAITGKTRAIIAVHLAGWPCEMDTILEIARKHNLYVIEDCAQASGATYKGRPVGSMGHINAFSFCQDKIMTTGGEGGMVTTNDSSLWERAWSFKDHGKNYRAVLQQPNGFSFKWVHETFGTNWRLTEMQSALGRILLSKLGERVSTRRRNAQILISELSQVPGIRIPVPGPGFGLAYYKFYVFCVPDELNDSWNRDRIIEAINKEGVPCAVGSCSEIYREKAFPEAWRPGSPLPTAQELGNTSMMFLVHSTLSPEDMLDTATAIKKVMSVAARSREQAAVSVLAA